MWKVPKTGEPLPPLMLTDAQIDGDEPAYEAWKVVLAHLEGFQDEEYEAQIGRLPRHWRAVYLIINLEAEVCNGGHHQFFWNSDGSWNKETLEDLEYIRAEPFIEIFRKALVEYARHDYVGDKRDSGNLWEGFTAAYKEKRMSELDSAFYDAPKSLAGCLSDYIRSHRELYSKR